MCNKKLQLRRQHTRWPLRPGAPLQPCSLHRSHLSPRPSSATPPADRGSIQPPPEVRRLSSEESVPSNGHSSSTAWLLQNGGRALTRHRLCRRGIHSRPGPNCLPGRIPEHNSEYTPAGGPLPCIHRIPVREVTGRPCHDTITGAAHQPGPLGPGSTRSQSHPSDFLSMMAAFSKMLSRGLSQTVAQVTASIHADLQ